MLCIIVNGTLFGGLHCHMHLSHSDISFPYVITNDCFVVVLNCQHVPVWLHRGRFISLKSCSLYCCVSITDCVSPLVAVFYEFTSTTIYYVWDHIFLPSNRAPREKSYCTETHSTLENEGSASANLQLENTTWHFLESQQFETVTQHFHLGERGNQIDFYLIFELIPDSKIHGANMGSI